MLQVSFNGISMNIERCFKRVLSVFDGCFKEVLIGCINESLKVFQKKFNECIQKVKSSFKDVLGEL